MSDSYEVQLLLYGNACKCDVHLFSVGKSSTFKCLICYGIPYEIVFSFPHMTLIMLLCAEIAKNRLHKIFRMQTVPLAYFVVIFMRSMNSIKVCVDWVWNTVESYKGNEIPLQMISFDCKWIKDIERKPFCKRTAIKLCNIPISMYAKAQKTIAYVFRADTMCDICLIY